MGQSKEPIRLRQRKTPAGLISLYLDIWKSHATLTLLAKQDLPTFGYNMIDPLKSWCWGQFYFTLLKFPVFLRP